MAYQPGFIENHSVSLPKIPSSLKDQVAPLVNSQKTTIDYFRHSIIMNKSRRFAFFSASNIDGAQWKKIDRSGNFAKDTKDIAEKFQLGTELYDAIKGNTTRPNDFEQGHLTSFQEVLWGRNKTERQKAASDTFFYTNCVPQHERVNSGLWRSLEQYILKTEAVNHGLKVSVITGPLLLDSDPFYIEKIGGDLIKIPLVFWKVIYYPNEKGLNAVGFMMSHRQLLIDDGTVTFDKNDVREAGITAPVTDLFMDYKYDKVYQVKVEFIQQQTKLEFMLDNVKLPFQKEVKQDVIYKRIEVTRTASAKLAPLATAELDYKIDQITL